MSVPEHHIRSVSSCKWFSFALETTRAPSEQLRRKTVREMVGDRPTAAQIRVINLDVVDVVHKIIYFHVRMPPMLETIPFAYWLVPKRSTGLGTALVTSFSLLLPIQIGTKIHTATPRTHSRHGKGKFLPASPRVTL